MNNKKINIFLIPSVILLWGFIILKLFFFSRVTKSESLPLSTMTLNRESGRRKDTVSISANYRDPFKSSSFKSVVQIESENQIKPVKIITMKPVWPNISYEGLIKSGKNGKQFALITIIDKKVVVEKNNEFSGIRVTEIFTDSIRVSFEKETKIILKN